jgi:hypothetical protein
MSTCHVWMVSADPSCLKWPRCLHGMLGWFSADPFYILNGQDVSTSCLGGLVQNHHILNGQDVYMSYLDGLVQTHLIFLMAKMSTCHAWMV